MSAAYRVRITAVPLLSFALLSLAIIMPNSSTATPYECEIKHTYSWWPKVKMENPDIYSSLIFDDEKGFFAVGVHGGFQLNVKQRLDQNGNGMIYASHEVKGQDYTGENTLTIRHYVKESEYLFVFTRPNGAWSGTCSIMSNHSKVK